MRIIRLKSLIITNFKGIKSLEIDFTGNETKIYGANGTGKSTLMDAFLWLLFGKDSQDRKDFDIKNTVELELNRQDHEVIGVLEVDGNQETLKHTYRENWVKKQGSKTSVMDGHEHLYSWNDVPLKAGEYIQRVAELLDESVFKLITSALYFNSLSWQQRREIIEKLAGTITDQEIVNQLIENEDIGDYSKLLEILNQRQTVEDYRKIIVGKKKTLNTSLDEIKPRIDECTRLMPDKIDFAAIEKEISKVDSGITDIDILITDRSSSHQSKNEVAQSKKNKISDLRNQNADFVLKIGQSFQDARRERNKQKSEKERIIEEINDNIKSKNALILSKQQVQARIENDMQALRERWELDKAREFKYDESKFSCPTCNRNFETDDIEATKRVMRKNYDDETNRLFEQTNKKGLELKSEKEENDRLMVTIRKALDDLKISLEAATTELSKVTVLTEENVETKIKEALANDAEYLARWKDIEKLENELSTNTIEEVDYTDLRESKANLNSQRDALLQQLSVRDKIKDLDKRIKDLKDQEITISDELTKLEGIEYSIENFTKAKIKIVEARTNDKFKYVKFKMFNQLINGSLEPTCITMYKDVPWGVLNTASRINAGLDIINALSCQYNISAPIWLDNRESTTHIIETSAQVIGLFVSEPDTQLRIT